MKRNQTTRHALASAFVMTLVATGCGAADEAADENGQETATQALRNGRAAAGNDAVTVSIKVADVFFGGGVLVAKNLVLTSRTIVQTSRTNGGVDNNCAQYDGDLTTLSVVPGLAANQTTPGVAVVRIITDGSPTACDNDLALLELAGPIENNPIARLRLDAGPVLGEPVRSAGWGTFQQRPGRPDVLQTADGSVLLVSGGPFTLAQASINLDPAYALTSAPVCAGDEGGPILDANGDLLGVVSAVIPQNYGAVDNDVLNSDECIGADSAATALAPHGPWIERAFQQYGLMPWRVGQVAPPGEVAQACVENHDCNSNLCIAVGGKKECSRTCTQDSDCGDVSTCVQTATASVCVSKVVDPPVPHDCDVEAVGMRGAVPGGVFALLGGVAMLAWRRKRAASR